LKLGDMGFIPQIGGSERPGQLASARSARADRRPSAGPEHDAFEVVSDCTDHFAHGIQHAV
jgi:hypothetical protein